MDIIILILYTFARVFRDFLERLLMNYAGCKYAAEAFELGVRNEELGIMVSASPTNGIHYPATTGQC